MKECFAARWDSARVGLTVVVSLVLGGAVAAAARRPDGAYLFEARCAVCHGRDGHGVSSSALRLNIPLKDLDMNEPSPKQTTTEQIRTLIENGKGKMPAFREKLTPEKIDAVVEYVQKLRGSAR